MAETLLLVCDTCLKPAVETVSLGLSSGNRQKDYCAAHLRALLKGSRAPKRGRKPRSPGTAAPASATRGKKTATGTRSAAKTAATGKKRAVPRPSLSAKPGYSKNGKRLGRPVGSKNKRSTSGA